MESVITTQTRDTEIGSEAQTPPSGTYTVTSRVVDIKLTDEVTIKATIYRPEGAPGKRPGMVFLHGAGTSTHKRFAPHAEIIASSGIVTMVPDKRMDTYTTATRDYLAMADDYEISADYLRAEDYVDPRRVGIYGESEGAYVAPLVAATNPQTAFLVLVSAPVVPPREQATFATDNYLRNTNVPTPLLSVIPRGLGPQFPGGALAYADFDVSDFQRRVSCPVFMAYGTADASMPIVQGAQQVIEDLAAGNNNRYTVRYYDHANHGIKVNAHIVPIFLRDVSRWVSGLPETAAAEPRIAGAQPVQQFRAETPPSPRWYASGDMMVIGLIAGPAIAFAAPILGGITAAIQSAFRKIRGKRGFAAEGSEIGGQTTGPIVTVLIRLAVAAALAAFASWVLYVAYLSTIATLATTYTTSMLAVDGGWVVTRLAGAFAAVVFVLASWALVRHNREATRLPVGAWIAISGSLLGAGTMLVSGAYWGIFSSIMTW